MSYLDISKFSFNDEILRGFKIINIDNLKINITDITVKFQKNRAIVFNIIIDDVNTINYLNKTGSINLITGEYYHYKFIATVDNFNNRGFHSPFFTYDIVIDLIELSKKDDFFINSKSNIQLQIIPTENMVKYMKRVNEEDLLKFNHISYEEYSLKLRYLLELNSLVYSTPILIERVILKHKQTTNILFQSQNIDENTVKRLDDIYPLLKNSHFVASLKEYLDSYIDFKNSKNTLNLLLKTYFIDDLIFGKENYNLNDISGFIDLFDGMFFKLNGTLEKKEFICSKCATKKKTKKKIRYLNEKIDFIINKLEPNLKEFKYDIDKDDKLAKVLANFRNMIRHQKDFEEFNLHKIMDFSKGLLKLYIIKNILKINDTDYNIDRILTDFNIYPLVEHKYKYLDKEISIYNTYTKENHMHKKLTDNTVYFSALKTSNVFKNAKSEDFVYDQSKTKKIKMIYIDNEDRIRMALLFFGIVVFEKNILQEENTTYPLTLTYKELIKNFGMSNLSTLQQTIKKV